VLDIRVARPFTTGRQSTTAIAEFENVLNMTNVVGVREFYGVNWLRPTTLQRGLNVRWGLQMRFWLSHSSSLRRARLSDFAS
jgi:hypothetical protein